MVTRHKHVEKQIRITLGSPIVGYLHIMAVLQKYIDQGISVNTSYNPTFYEDEKIPMSEMLIIPF